MDGLIKIENIILELLGTHQCVTVPGLGSFIDREAPASANHFTFELKPSGNSVFFNNAILADDGILANALREKMGISYTEALHTIHLHVSEITTLLQTKKNLGFGKLGNFFMNAEGNIFFLPSGTLNLSRNSFGLGIIKLTELQKPVSQSVRNETPEIVLEPIRKPALEPVQEYEQAEILEMEESHPNRGIIWKIAAGFAIVTLAGTGWYFGKHYLGNKSNTSTEMATVDVSEKPEMVVPAESAEEKNGLGEKGSSTGTPMEKPKQEKEIKKETSSKAAVVNRPKEVISEIVSKENYYQKIQQQKGNFFLVGGSFIGEEMAKSECKKWNQVGVNATIHKAENSSLYRIILGRFNTEQAASNFVQTMPGFHGSSVSVRDLPKLKYN